MYKTVEHFEHALMHATTKIIIIEAFLAIVEKTIKSPRLYHGRHALMQIQCLMDESFADGIFKMTLKYHSSTRRLTLIPSSAIV
jgi:hypothetical protein